MRRLRLPSIITASPSAALVVRTGLRLLGAVALLLCFDPDRLLAATATDDGRTAANVVAALSTFRTEGPKGWSFTQTTEGDGRSRVERFDAAQPEFARWTLLQENGRAPTEDETRDYREKLSRRSRGGTAPQLAEQLDPASLELVETTTDRSTYRLRLRPGEEGDVTARFLRATLVFHHPTQTIESLEIASTGAFSPTFGVQIAEMRTLLRYSLPEADRPSLLLEARTRLRGRAFLFKSLDADLRVTFTDYQKAGRK